MIPSIVMRSPEDPASRRERMAMEGQFRQQIHRLRRSWLGHNRLPSQRREGIRLLQGMTHPAAQIPLVEELSGEAPDVRAALLDHLRTQGAEGQAALAYAAIYSPDPGFSTAAGQALSVPLAPAVYGILDTSLRSPVHDIANRAAALAGNFNAIETIPLLIFSQVTRDPVPEHEGDLAWIANQTQHAYVANLIPVTGPGVVAYQPVIGRVTEGTLLRIMDAVVVVYRTVVHDVLVDLSSRDGGDPTDTLGYDPSAWWQWYHQDYLPAKREQLDIRRIEERIDATRQQAEQDPLIP